MGPFWNRFYSRHCCGRHGLPCGRHGYVLWPSWCVAVVAVAVMVCGRHGICSLVVVTQCCRRVGDLTTTGFPTTRTTSRWWRPTTVCRRWAGQLTFVCRWQTSTTKIQSLCSRRSSWFKSARTLCPIPSFTYFRPTTRMAMESPTALPVTHLSVSSLEELFDTVTPKIFLILIQILGFIVLNWYILLSDLIRIIAIFLINLCLNSFCNFDCMSLHTCADVPLRNCPLTLFTVFYLFKYFSSTYFTLCTIL